MKKRYHYTIENNILALHELLDKLTDLFKKMNLRQVSVTKVKLVIEELICNTIRYGYDTDTDAEGIIELVILPNKKSLRLEFTDNSKPFDPTEKREYTVPNSVEELKIGGLGLILVRKACSRMKYLHNNGRNYLSVTVPTSSNKKKNYKK